MWRSGLRLQWKLRLEKQLWPDKASAHHAFHTCQADGQTDPERGTVSAHLDTGHVIFPHQQANGKAVKLPVRGTDETSLQAPRRLPRRQRCQLLSQDLSSDVHPDAGSCRLRPGWTEPAAPAWPWVERIPQRTYFCSKPPRNKMMTLTKREKTHSRQSLAGISATFSEVVACSPAFDVRASVWRSSLWHVRCEVLYVAQ